MGWWPAKLCVVLNIVIALGYGVTNCLTAGLILSAVNDHGMKPWVGIVVSALITWVIATFGYRWFFNFERSAGCMQTEFVSADNPLDSAGYLRS